MKTRHILITGPSGSGKTTLARFFNENGKIAVDLDISGIGICVDKNGDIVPIPDDIHKKTINVWMEKNNLQWCWDERKLKKLLDRYKGKEAYFFGASYNMYEFANLFDMKFYLDAKKNLIIKRLASRLRDPKSYHRAGATKGQRKQIFDSLQPFLEGAKKESFVIVDASQTLRQIFDIICNSKTGNLLFLA